MEDRDTVIEALQYLISGECTDTQFDYLDEIEAAIAMLKEQRKQKFLLTEDGRIIPLPIIVRCKDCKHWDSKKNECHNINSYMQYRPCFKDWYCADGKRKDS